MKNNRYIHLAKVYEHLMRNIDYRGWGEYLLDIADYYELRIKSSLELAAGNCKLTNYLYDKMPGLIATDVSYHMLKQDNKNKLDKTACDMTLLPFRTRFDFIFCTFDSVNYLSNTSQLRKFLLEAGSLLTDEGLLTFDVSLEKNSIKNVKHLNRKGRFDGIRYEQESEYYPDNALHVNRFKLTLPDNTKIQEVHEQKIFHFNEYFEVIDDTNLYVSDCFDFFTFKDAGPDCERIQFILRKI